MTESSRLMTMLYSVGGICITLVLIALVIMTRRNVPKVFAVDDKDDKDYVVSDGDFDENGDCAFGCIILLSLAPVGWMRKLYAGDDDEHFRILNIVT